MKDVYINLQTGEQTEVDISEAEAAKRNADYQAFIDAIPYYQKRRKEYPPIADYLDGIVKGDQEQIAKYIADCLAVKAKYPKQ